MLVYLKYQSSVFKTLQSAARSHSALTFYSSRESGFHVFLCLSQTCIEFQGPRVKKKLPKRKIWYLHNWKMLRCSCANNLCKLFTVSKSHFGEVVKNTAMEQSHWKYLQLHTANFNYYSRSWPNKHNIRWRSIWSDSSRNCVHVLQKLWDLESCL